MNTTTATFLALNCTPHHNEWSCIGKYNLVQYNDVVVWMVVRAHVPEVVQFLSLVKDMFKIKSTADLR